VKNRTNFKMAMVVASILLLGHVVHGYASAQVDLKKLPPLVIWTAYDVGTTTYMQTACMADGVTKKVGMKIRILPSGNDIGRLIPVRSNVAHFGTMSAGSAYACINGLYEYGRYEWGPQPIRQILAVIDRDQGFSIATAASANIKTPKDMKGKRLTLVPGGTSLNLNAEATLAFGGLTWDDVVIIPAPSLATSMKFIGEGKTDGAFASTTSPAMYEVERSPYGVHWLELPADDKAGWERLLKLAPYMVPVSATKGVAASPKEPKELMSYAYPLLLCYANLKDDVAYAMLKAIDQSFDLYKACNAVMPSWQLKKAVTLEAQRVPYHPGAIRYLKEVKLWTPEMEKKQKVLIEDQNRLKKIWDEALAEATSKGMKEQDFTEFWTKKRGAVVN
jgi:TRAP transporter TAXI family solute receptor